jgi:hypothetical protein
MKKKFRKTGREKKVFRFYNLDETIELVLKLKGMDKPVCIHI